jgi:hypothetical protein
MIEDSGWMTEQHRTSNAEHRMPGPLTPALSPSDGARETEANRQSAIGNPQSGGGGEGGPANNSDISDISDKPIKTGLP